MTGRKVTATVDRGLLGKRRILAQVLEPKVNDAGELQYNDVVKQQLFAPDARRTAQRWCERLMPDSPVGDVRWAEVYEQEFRANDYDSAEFGRVLDVECVDLTKQEGSLKSDGGGYDWDEPEDLT